MADDRHTTTPEAAAAWEAARGWQPDDLPDADALGGLGGPVTRDLTTVEAVHGDLVLDGLYLPVGATLQPTTGDAVVLTTTDTLFAARVISWAEDDRDDYDVLVRSGAIFLRHRP